MDTLAGLPRQSLSRTAPLPADTVFDKLYVTHDGGGTWMPVPTPSIFEGGTLDFVDGPTGWALNGVRARPADPAQDD